MPPVVPPESAVAVFLRTVARSGLIPPDRLARAAAAVPDRPAPAVADHLVAGGLLTRYQADKLLQGSWQGLRVGPYRLLCPLGRGGMGIVYLARDDRPAAGSRLVALKVLLQARARDEPRTLARFRREMAIGAALPPHPGLTRTADAGEDGPVHYLAMEYVPGPTLSRVVGESGPLSVGAACRAFADAAGGLAAAHGAGFVHRDFKPANLILTPAGRGKVLDFGFALRIGEPAPADPALLGGRGYTVGTMDYLPPEQAADAAGVGPAADLYALGCALYFALTGTPPFPGGGPQDKIRAHRTAPAPLLTDGNPTLPADLGRVVGWLLNKRPAARPKSAADVARLLLPWADPVPPDADRMLPDDESVRRAEARWLAGRAALGPDDGESGGESEAVGDDEPPAEPQLRLPVGWRAAAGIGVAAVAGAFALGVLAGRLF